MTSVQLTKPIKAHGKEVSELTFREPTMDDMIVCGYPLILGEGKAEPIPSNIAKYIARLAEIPPSSVKQMSAPDVNACIPVIVDFFGASEAEATS